MAFQILKELESIENFIFTLSHEGNIIFRNFRRYNINLEVRQNHEIP